MESITIRLREEADDPAIVKIRNEANPHFPPTSLEEYRYQADPTHSPEGTIQERFVAEREGEILGLYVLNELRHVLRPHTYAANIGVAKGHRGQGLGNMLYRHLEGRLHLHGATRIYGRVSEDQPEAMAFFERRGFSRTGRADRMSRLVVREANLEGYDGAVERAEDQGIRIQTLREIGMDDQQTLRRIHRMSFESARDIPSSEELEEFPFETWVQWLESPGNSPDQVWVALEGAQPVGVASLSRRGEHAAFNNYTGVDRQYRGRGLARALKLKTIEFARAQGIEEIFTGNDIDNKRMLSINIPLGYQAVPSQIEIAKDL